MPVWMSLQDAEARAGPFDALRPDLQADGGGPPRIMARAEGFYTSEGNPWKRAPVDGRIPADWWAQLRNVDPAANRATFRRPGFAFVSVDPGDKVKSFEDDITAIGVELERAAVEARFLEATVSAAVSRHVGGEDPEHEPVEPKAAAAQTPAGVPERAATPKQKSAKVSKTLIDAAFDCLRKKYPDKYSSGFAGARPTVLRSQARPIWPDICKAEGVSTGDYPLPGWDSWKRGRDRHARRSRD